MYKLAAKEEDGVFIPTLKVSSSYEKTTNPGIKQVYRFYDEFGSALADLITLDDEHLEEGVNIPFYHPFSTQDFFIMKKKKYSHFKAMLNKKMDGGKRVYPEINIHELQRRSAELLTEFDKSYKRQINPHIYKVSLSSKLRELKTKLIMEAKIEEDKDN